MNKTLRTKSSNNRIISFMVILGLFVLSMSGCQQVNDMVNGNQATNSNAAANTNAATNANSNANSNVTANSNANANTSVVPSNSAANTNNQASNTATAAKEEVPLTPEVMAFKNTLVGTWENERKDKTTFSKDKVGFQDRTPELPYKVVNEKTVEIYSIDGSSVLNNATITFEDNGNTLIWLEKGKTFRCKRVK